GQPPRRRPRGRAGEAPRRCPFRSSRRGGRGGSRAYAGIDHLQVTSTLRRRTRSITLCIDVEQLVRVAGRPALSAVGHTASTAGQRSLGRVAGTGLGRLPRIPDGACPVWGKTSDELATTAGHAGPQGTGPPTAVA